MDAHEVERVAQLYALADPDAPSDPEIEDLVADAAEVAGVPMATLNLLDTERQCNVSSVGFEGSTTPRQEAMCNVTIAVGSFVSVADARDDPRFATNPWVDGRRADIRFYASAPLLTSQNYAIGTLCAFDDQPHELSDDQIDQLQDLAARIVKIFERKSPRSQ